MKTKHIHRALFALATLFALLSHNLIANNVQLANVRMRGQDETAGPNHINNFRMVEFNISWENSWRTDDLETNWDGVWVFVKFRNLDYDTWFHATIDDAGHVTQAGAEIIPSGDNKGVYIQRTATNLGIGDVNWEKLALKWRYRLDGLNDYDSVQVCVFAIEMVYVPQTSYYLGDGTTNSVRGQFSSANTTDFFQVTSEGAITLGGGGVGSLGNRNASGMAAPVDDFNNATSQTLPAAFQKGFNAFYIMKYEISQEQYVEFLNKLTRAQQPNRALGITLVGRYYINNTTPQNRNGIKLMSDPGGSSPRVYGNDLNNNGIASDAEDGQNIACNWLSVQDLHAYLDWSGLRPMTELEYEKASRGQNLFPVADEFAWGTTNITSVSGITNSGRNNERPSNASANVNILNTTTGPMRCGTFAEDDETRQSAGATYFGIMEMTGNIWELVVGVGNAAGRGFTGVHGNGALDINGLPDVAGWPTALGQRGGAYSSTASADGRISDRANANWNNAGRFATTGGRGVRTAP
jgi:formylglycine-generating enzyme required for sulfatase activity